LTGHDQLGPYDDIKASGSGISSEDSCYGSHDLSRSSSSAHAVARPLLLSQDRSASISSTSVEYAIPLRRQQSSYNNNTNLQQQQYQFKTFHSTSTLKKTVQSLTRRPIVDLKSTYLTYDSIDAPPSTSSSPTASTTSREYSI
jgi:hypothetical protein